MVFAKIQRLEALSQQLVDDPELAEKEWTDMAIELYDKLTGRGAEISYEFDKMEISIPTGTGEESSYALWKINGTLKIRSRDAAKGK